VSAELAVVIRYLALESVVPNSISASTGRVYNAAPRPALGGLLTSRCSDALLRIASRPDDVRQRRTADPRDRAAGAEGLAAPSALPSRLRLTPQASRSVLATGWRSRPNFGLKMRRVQPPAQRLFELRGDCDQRALFAAAADQLHPDRELGVRATMSGSRAAGPRGGGRPGLSR
jgi:hypothetical protein